MIELAIVKLGVQHDLACRRSIHQQMVDAFMGGIPSQATPPIPIIPAPAVRELRARLILEEALETINAMGVTVIFSGIASTTIPKNGDFMTLLNRPDENWVAPHKFQADGECDIVEVVDGCCDIKVVTTGTLTAFGVSDDAMQFEVDSNNLRKFAEGHTIREDGKLVKPPNHPNPRIYELLKAQGAPEQVLHPQK